tara:strand:- start:120 stop:818 length:699 start_codon:yes stop_codon:yes gene_type:complete
MNNNRKKNVLIISPHYDDEVLGCGGYVSKYNNSKNFYILFLTNANKGDPTLYNENLINKIRNEAKKSSNYLKVKKIFFENLPAPKLDIFSSSTISDKITYYLNNIKPSEVFIPFFNDTHVDHQKIYSASITSLRPFLKTNKNLKSIYCYETLSETDYSLPGKSIFNPNYFVELTKKNLSEKIQAMKYYKSQIKKQPHPRSVNGIKILASYRGLLSNTEYSEAFMILRVYDKK